MRKRDGFVDNRNMGMEYIVTILHYFPVTSLPRHLLFFICPYFSFCFSFLFGICSLISVRFLFFFLQVFFSFSFTSGLLLLCFILIVFLSTPDTWWVHVVKMKTKIDNINTWTFLKCGYHIHECHNVKRNNVLANKIMPLRYETNKLEISFIFWV